MDVKGVLWNPAMPSTLCRKIQHTSKHMVAMSATRGLDLRFYTSLMQSPIMQKLIKQSLSPSWKWRSLWEDTFEEKVAQKSRRKGTKPADQQQQKACSLPIPTLAASSPSPTNISQLLTNFASGTKSSPGTSHWPIYRVQHRPRRGLSSILFRCWSSRSWWILSSQIVKLLGSAGVRYLMAMCVALIRKHGMILGFVGLVISCNRHALNREPTRPGHCPPPPRPAHPFELFNLFLPPEGCATNFIQQEGIEKKRNQTGFSSCHMLSQDAWQLSQQTGFSSMWQHESPFEMGLWMSLTGKTLPVSSVSSSYLSWNLATIVIEYLARSPSKSSFLLTGWSNWSV